MAKQEHWISARGCVYNVYYHFVWSTKYRKPVLVDEVMDYLKELNEEIAGKREVTIHEQEVNPDHVHLFVTAHPKWSPSQLAKIFKGVSARFLFERFPELKNQLYKGHLWNPSFYIGTVGDVTKDVIRKYVEMQRVKPRETSEDA